MNRFDITDKMLYKDNVGISQQRESGKNEIADSVRHR